MDTNLEVITTPAYDNYYRSLDFTVQAKFTARLKRLESGNWGKVSPVGNGVSELQFKGIGPGYRIYCKAIGKKVVVILGAGTKRQQQADIDAAIEYANTNF